MQTLFKPKLNHVDITSKFWSHYQQLVVKEVLPYQWSVMNDEASVDISEDPQNNGINKNSHAIANLKIAAGQQKGHHYGFPFQDTDVYKWLEAAAYSFSYQPNNDLKTITDTLVSLIADAQEDNGYLSTLFQIDEPQRKFKRLQQSHELYTMGHYIEAGVAYYQATGSGKALTIATKMADCICRNFGADPDQIHGYDGHPEIELALVKLYEVTNDQRYLDMAHYFLVERGTDPDFFDKQNIADGLERDLIPNMRDMPRTYYQADKPIKDQQTAEGHAVRVVYLCTGMASVALYTHDQTLLDACHRFWNDIVKRRMYITGNIGSTTTGESLTYDYDLPNDTMYGETCASVGMAFFAKKMLQLESKGEYADILEKELFNGSLSGMSLDGKHFFYVNPLEADPKASALNPGKSHVLTHRADWFGCACCPANLARLITSLSDYLYTEKDNTILAHQFIANKAAFNNKVSINQKSDFPWSGDVLFEITNPENCEFRFGIRIPQWSLGNYQLSINGHLASISIDDGFVYIPVNESKMTITLSLDMSVKFMAASNRIVADQNKIAVQRGPVIYCAEEADNHTSQLGLYHVSPKANVLVKKEPTLLNGVTTLDVSAQEEELTNADDNPYQPLTSEKTIPANLRLIPYYAWANRTEGAMRVWLNR